MGDAPHDYDEAMVALLQMLWGPGYLSPGGPEAVAAIVAGVDLRDANVLDIGCGLGGPSATLLSLGAATVTGVDVASELIGAASADAVARGLEDRLSFVTIEPEQPLPFGDAEFDVVFTKDAWLHVVDKAALLAEAHRVLRPGGYLTAGDWLKGPDPYSADMLYFIELEGIPYHQATLEEYEQMLQAAGFTDVTTFDAAEWYTSLAADEYDRLRGELRDELTSRLGATARDHFIENWRMLKQVTAGGELRPARFQARKPL